MREPRPSPKATANKREMKQGVMPLPPSFGPNPANAALGRAAKQMTPRVIANAARRSGMSEAVVKDLMKIARDSVSRAVDEARAIGVKFRGDIF